MPAPLERLGPDLKKRLDKLERDVERSKKDTQHAAGRTAKAAQEDPIAADSGGDQRLSRVRSGKGAKVGARYDITPIGDVEIKAIGPLPLIANNIKAHAITGKKGRKLSIPGVGVRSSAQHPGTTGKDTWNRGRETAEREVTKVIGVHTDAAVRRSFREAANGAT